MTRIPKILHYCFGMKADFGGKPWSLMHYVCVASALRHLKPETVYFYYQYEPSGPWWDLTKPLVTPVKIEAPREIFGRPVSHPAHRADVVRLQKIREFGGIYLDADVLVQRSFDDLLDNSVVLGREGFDITNPATANAIILAEPHAPFIERWLDEYRSFRGDEGYWGEHSVLLPARLAREHPDEITILPPTAFFWPLWSEGHMQWMFDSADPIPTTDVYANHLWESFAWPYVWNLTPGEVRAKDTNFNRLARPYLEGLPDDFGKLPLSTTLLQRAKKAKRALRGSLTWGFPLRLARRGRAWLRAQIENPNSSEPRSRGEIFEDVYRNKRWGHEEGAEFFSGSGSRGRAAEDYVREMTALLKEHEEELGRPVTVVDIGCGDFQIGRALVERMPTMTYVGCDIVPSLIEHNQENYASDRVRFQQLDIVEDRPPSGDVCLVRQVLQHLSNDEIERALQNLSGRFTAIYVTEGQPELRVGPFNPDKPTGSGVRFNWERGVGRGLELAEAPFNRRAEEVFRSFSPPHEVIVTERIDVETHDRQDAGSVSQAIEGRASFL
jgi:SAM-dependent methyltransferase